MSQTRISGQCRQARFEYAPLGSNDIRLVQLESFDHERGIVEFTMTQERLDSSDFLALSYTWGDPIRTKMILLNGQPLRITLNLEGFLRTFATGHPEMNHSKLWIDAICINQEDLEERNAQVLRMSSIYSSAQEVIVWLGEQTEEAAVEYAEMTRLCEQLAVSDDSHKENVYLDILESFTIMSRLGRMDFLLNSPWWRRLWVLQEFVLAKRVRFLRGLVDMDYHVLFEIVYGVVSRGAFPLKPEDLEWKYKWSSILNLLELRPREGSASGRFAQQYKPRLSLLDLLTDFNRSNCLDPRDRVYSLLGACSDIRTGDIIPHYQKAVRDVYMDAVVAHILRNNNLDFLFHGDADEEDNHLLHSNTKSSWPGWLPRFGSYGVAYKLAKSKDGTISYDASRWFSFSTYPWSIDSIVGTLTVFGAIVDVVTCISPCGSEDTGIPTCDEEMFERLRAYAKLVRELPPVYGLTGETTEKAFSKTILAHHPYLLRMSFVDEVFDRVTNLETTLDTKRDLLTRTSPSVNFRKMAITSTGMMSLVPTMTMPGDCVVFLVGGPVFYVLRALPDDQHNNENPCSTRRFRFIGDSYVHGLMDGEIAELGLNLEPIVVL